MRIFLGIAGMLVAASGLFLPMIQALFPKIGVIFYYRQRLCRRLLYASGAVLVFLSMLFGFATLTWVA